MGTHTYIDTIRHRKCEVILGSANRTLWGQLVKISALDQQCQSLRFLHLHSVWQSRVCYCNFLLTSTALLVCYSRSARPTLGLCIYIIVLVLHHLIMTICAYGLYKRVDCWLIERGSRSWLDTWVRDICFFFNNACLSLHSLVTTSDTCRVHWRWYWEGGGF